MSLLCLLALTATSRRPAEAQGGLSGTIVTADSGRLLPGVEVLLPASGARTVSNSTGSFVLRDLRPGPTRLTARRIGLQPLDVVLDVPARGMRSVTLRMSALAMRLDSLTVTVENPRRQALLAEFDRRRASGIGDFLTRSQLLDREFQSLETVLREFGVSPAGRPQGHSSAGVGGSGDLFRNRARTSSIRARQHFLRGHRAVAADSVGGA